ncbi:unnamed protein product, partial [marine sediment metagenome]
FEGSNYGKKSGLNSGILLDFEDLEGKCFLIYLKP